MSKIARRSAAVAVAAPIATPRIIALWLASFPSVATREGYGAELRRFGEFTRREPEAAIAALLAARDGEAHALLDAWTATLRAAALAPATVNRRIAAVVSLVRYARRLGATTLRLEPKREKAKAYRDTRGPALATIIALGKAAEAGAAPARDLAILAALFFMGLRRGELVTLNVGDVALGDRRLAITGKGRREPELVTIPDAAAAAFARLLAERPADPAAPLFVSLGSLRAAGQGERVTGKRISGRGVADRLASLSAAAGVATVRPHGLRHAAVTQALKAGASVLAASAFARHADVKTTMIYADNLADAGGAVGGMLSDALARAAWL